MLLGNADFLFFTSSIATVPDHLVPLTNFVNIFVVRAIWVMSLNCQALLLHFFLQTNVIA